MFFLHKVHKTKGTAVLVLLWQIAQVKCLSMQKSTRTTVPEEINTPDHTRWELHTMSLCFINPAPTLLILHRQFGRSQINVQLKNWEKPEFWTFSHGTRISVLLQCIGWFCHVMDLGFAKTVVVAALPSLLQVIKGLRHNHESEIIENNMQTTDMSYLYLLVVILDLVEKIPPRQRWILKIISHWMETIFPDSSISRL